MEAPDLKRKLVAILAGDFEGFSRHMERDEAGTVAVLSSHRRTIDAAISQFGGRITGTAGDFVLAEFESVVSAINCAVQIQQELAEENAHLDLERRLFLRIGVNVGDVMVKDEALWRWRQYCGPVGSTGRPRRNFCFQRCARSPSQTSHRCVRRSWGAEGKEHC